MQPGLLSVFVGLAIPLGVAALLASFGHTVLALVVAGIGLAILALRVVAPRYGEILMKGLGAFGAWVGRMVSAVLLTVIYFTVFTPVAFVARLLGRDPLALGAEAGGWRELGADPTVRLFKRSFSREENAPRSTLPRKTLRFSKRLLAGAGVLLLVDMGIGGAGRLTLRPFSESPDVRQFAQVYRDVPWRTAYWDEYARSGKTHYEPYVGWRRDDFQGEHISIRDGVRASYASPTASADAPLVHMYGGSTTWGVGARDAHTISSEIARLAEENGQPLRVRNFGENGWVSWQGAILLSHHLSTGERPDVVVFYDGANDVVAKLASPGDYHPPQNITSRKVRFDASFSSQGRLQAGWSIYSWFSATQILFRRLSPKKRVDVDALLGERSLEQLASEVATAYLSHTELVTGIGTAYGFVPLFFWQPLAGTKELPSEAERSYKVAGSFGFDTETVVRLLDLAGDELVSTGEVHDLRKALDDLPQSLYIDWAHTTEEGNRRIAERMYPLVVKALSAQRIQGMVDAR